MNIHAQEEERQIARRLGAALARARRARGLSQAALGRTLGLAQASVSKMESGAASVSVPLLVRWAAVLSVEPWVVLAEAAGSAQQATIVRAVADMAREEPRAWTTMKLLLTRPVRDTVP